MIRLVNNLYADGLPHCPRHAYRESWTPRRVTNLYVAGLLDCLHHNPSASWTSLNEQQWTEFVAACENRHLHLVGCPGYPKPHSILTVRPMDYWYSLNNFKTDRKIVDRIAKYGQYECDFFDWDKERCAIIRLCEQGCIEPRGQRIRYGFTEPFKWFYWNCLTRFEQPSS